MSNLPYEIQEQILLRLPARSVLCLSLVCKKWRSLILDPKFVIKHPNLDLSNGPLKVIIHRIVRGDDSSRNSVILQSIDYETLNSTNFELRFQAPVVPVIIGCCNGFWLLSLGYKNDALVLWNPLLTEKYNHKYLPESNFAASYTSHFKGFGYAPSIDDYKVVRLHRKICEVYSLKTNSWKIIPGVPTSKINSYYQTDRKGTHIRGSIYWIIHDLQNAAVIALDLITEKFKLLETPPVDDDNVHHKLVTNMLEIRGCVGAYRSICNHEDTVIWIWNEDENRKGYWIKLLTIPSSYPTYTRVLSFVNNNEVLLRDDEGRMGNLVIYDSACDIFRDIPCGNVGWPVHMAETLVSPVF